MRDNGPIKQADLLRILLMRKYGGMWIDATSYMPRDLSWIKNIKNQRLVHNKIDEEPDVLIGGYSQGKIAYLHEWKPFFQE